MSVGSRETPGLRPSGRWKDATRVPDRRHSRSDRSPCHDSRSRRRRGARATFHTWAIHSIFARLVDRVVVANPLQVRAIALARINTDKIDAHTVPALRMDFLPEVELPGREAWGLRQLVAHRRQLVKQRTGEEHDPRSVAPLPHPVPAAHLAHRQGHGVGQAGRARVGRPLHPHQPGEAPRGHRVADRGGDREAVEGVRPSVEWRGSLQVRFVLESKSTKLLKPRLLRERVPNIPRFRINDEVARLLPGWSRLLCRPLLWERRDLGEARHHLLPHRVLTYVGVYQQAVVWKEDRPFSAVETDELIAIRQPNRVVPAASFASS